MPLWGLRKGGWALQGHTWLEVDQVNIADRAFPKMIDYICTHKDTKFTWAPTSRCSSSWKPHHGVELACHWDPAANTAEAAMFTQTGKAPTQLTQQRSGDRDGNTASLSKSYCLREVSAWRLTLAWEGVKKRKRLLPACPGIPAFPWRTAPTHLCLNTAQLPPQWLRNRAALFCSKQVSSVLQAQKKPSRTSFLLPFTNS